MDFHSFFFFNSSFLFCFLRLGPVSEALNIVCLFGFVFIIFTSLTTEQVSVAPHKVMLKVSPKAMVLTRQKKNGWGGGSGGRGGSRGG